MSIFCLASRSHLNAVRGQTVPLCFSAADASDASDAVAFPGRSPVMSSLTLTFQNGRGTFTLEGTRMAPPGHIHATVTDVLQPNIDMAVYSAETDQGPRLIKVGFSAVEMDAIDREARIYDELLRDLMGTDVVKVYGSYKGKNEDGRSASCIVAEGISGVVDAESSLPNLPMYQRREIAVHLGRLHLAGVLPVFDLGGGNVARLNDGSLRIGHFQDLRRHDPPCAWDGNWRFNEAQPEPGDFRCYALYEAAKEMGIWRSQIMDLSSMIVSQTTVVEESYSE